MISFKQFLLEGGKATADAGTVRANKKDIETALAFIAKQTGIPLQTLQDNLLGSTTHTLKGLKKDSGDIDIAFEGSIDSNKELVQAMRAGTKASPVKIGGNTLSFPVPTYGGRKVQVDFMFVPSNKWAKWMYHAAEDSKYKGKIRNALLRAVAASHIEPGKDLVITDKDDNLIVRVRKSLKNDEGLVRLHKVAKPRKDGKGRVKSLSDASKEDIEDAIGEYGNSANKYSMEKDQVLDPDEVAKILFGKGVRAKDLMSTEQVAKKILQLPNAEEIVNAAIGHEMSKQEVPDLLKHLVK